MRSESYAKVAWLSLNPDSHVAIVSRTALLFVGKGGNGGRARGFFLLACILHVRGVV